MTQRKGNYRQISVSNSKISKIGFLILILLLGSILFQYCASTFAIGEARIEGANKSSTSRSVKGLTMDTVTLTGYFENGKAIFTIEYNFYVLDNTTNFTLPLVGPADKAMALNLTVDGMEERVRFSNNYYYHSGKFKIGEHNLTFKFNSNQLLAETISLNYTLYGPALKYLVEFKIPYTSGERIFIIESGNGMLSENNKMLSISWEYFAKEYIHWSLAWTRYIPPPGEEIRCEMGSEVMIYEKKAIFDINYDLEFKGFSLEKLTFDLDDQTTLRWVDFGTIKNEAKKAKIIFEELIKDRISLQLTFEKWFNTELEITIPRPLNSKLSGDVALFSEPNVMIEQKENIDAVLIGYSGYTKLNSNFIGNYHFTEKSKLILNVTLKETMVSAEVVDTLIPTFDGYDIETWILFNFYGNSPSSLTLELPMSSSAGKSQKPQLITDPSIPLPIIDYSWNSNLNRLSLWLEGDISNEYLLGLLWHFPGNNVTLESLTIAETQITGYYVAYYLEKGVQYDHIYNSGLSRSGYDELPKQLKARLQTGTNVDVFRVVEKYLSILAIKKTTDLTSEIFLRVWISDLGMDVHQLVRITSEGAIASAYTFSIPAKLTSITVSSCASWTIIEDQLVVYTFKDTKNLITFYIDGKMPNGSGEISPFIPQNIEGSKIYTMFGSASDLDITIEPSLASALNPDELPKYFLSEIKTPKAVSVYSSTQEPSFKVTTEQYPMEEQPTTIIELAQVTFITSIDGKLATQVIYRVKNVDSVAMQVTLPTDVVVWMVLVGGKTIPIIQNDDVLTVTLIRSTLSGENIAFPVEIVYMLPEPSANLEFMIPQADVSILNLKVNIGLPSSVKVLDPEKFNPNFELDSWDKWKTKKESTVSGSELYTDHAKLMNSKIAEVSYDRAVVEPDWLYIGLEDLNGDSDVLEIERLDASEDEQNSYSVQIDSSNSHFDPISNMSFARISLFQGQYEIHNAGVKRQVTVMGGATQQIIFDSEDEMVFTDVPPIYLQFPQSGQVLRLSAIFLKPDEKASILLIEGEEEGASFVNKLSSLVNSAQFLQLIIFLIIIFNIVLVYYLLVVRPKKSKVVTKPQKLSRAPEDSAHQPTTPREVVKKTGVIRERKVVRKRTKNHNIREQSKEEIDNTTFENGPKRNKY